MVHRLLLIALTALSFSACHTQKDLAYFEDIKNSASGIIEVASYETRIVPEDELLITVTSEIPAATTSFNRQVVNSISRNELQGVAANARTIDNASNTNGANRIPTYIVDREGNIDFPVLGELHVEGMTTRELAAYIKGKVSETVKDPIVSVTLVNFKVNVIGEVSSPRTINVTTEKFSIIDAIASCGDLSAYGKRDNVIVMRELPDGNREYHRVNLHDTELFKSPYFYLKQNDIVYVEPNDIKQSNSKYNSQNSYKLSAISTVVSGASVIASLVIALTVK